MSVPSGFAGDGQALEASGEAKRQAITRKYPPLSEETRSHVDTECAAYHSGFAVSTLLSWSSRGNGLLKPIRRGNRLGWSVAELRKLNGEAAQ